MKKLALILLSTTFLADAQYAGRSGVRYMSDATFRVRRAGDWNATRTDGYCRIRVRIDDEADVELRGEEIHIRVIKGGPGRDEGSECNAPLPTGGRISNFRFNGVDGRGTPRLVQEPSDRNFYVAVINVQDPRGGDEGFTFDLRWNSDGSGGGSGGGGLFPDPGSGSGGGAGDFSTSGNGSVMVGNQNQPFQRVTANMRQNGSYIIDVAGGYATKFSGKYRNLGNGRYELDVNGGFAREGARGTGTLNVSGGNITSLNMEGNTVRTNDRFTVNFDNRGGSGGGGGGGGFFPGDGQQGGFFPGGGQNVSWSQAGRGNFVYDRTTEIQQATFNASNGRATIVLMSGGNRAEFVGTVTRGTGNVYEVQLNTSSQGSVSGTARIVGDNRNGINTVSLNGDLNGRRFQANFGK